jgi:alpha-tubulin suppressor-like RCC1 family protein
VAFCIEGGTNSVAYDIFTTTNLLISITNSAQWTWLGQGYACNSYTFTNQRGDLSFYALAIPQQTMVVAWGDNSSGQCNVPANLTNAIAIAGGYNFSLALRSDGTVVAWGSNIYGQTNVPAGLSNVVGIAANWYGAVALKNDGKVVQWGGSVYQPPASATNLTMISMGYSYALAVRTDGGLFSWGQPTWRTNLIGGLTNIISIAAATDHKVVAQGNGLVFAWGDDLFHELDMPADLTNAVAVSAANLHTLALRNNNMVAAWGYNGSGQTNVPAGLSNVVAVAAGGTQSLALMADGTVVAWGNSSVPEGLNGVKAVAAGYGHNLALRSGSLTPVIILQPTDQFGFAGSTINFSALGVGIAPIQYQWQFNGVNIAGATNAALTLTNIQQAQVGSYVVVVTDGNNVFITSSNAAFNLPVPPTIVSQSQPTNPVAVYQTNLTLSVVATAPGQYLFPLGYQWQFNGTNIAGANTATYSFIVNSPGTYSVVVTNGIGSTTASWQVTITYVGTYIAPGTLAYHLSTNAAGYATGYAGGYADEMAVTNWTSSTYLANNMYLLTNAIWSTNFWLKGVKGLSASALGISNNSGGERLLTMISPRHYLRASHVGEPPGMIAFLDTNNTIFWRTSLQQITVGDLTNDTDVGILNADLPASVGYLPVFPTNYANYLPTNYYSYVQGIGMNQDQRIFGQPMLFGSPAYIYWDNLAVVPFGLGTNWNVAIRYNDSSDPERLLISN